MTRIGNVDHVLMLLQQQLQKMDGTSRKTPARKADKTGKADAHSSLRRVAAIAGKNELDDETFARALVRALLVDELGEGLTEDHRFDRISAEVHRMIAKDEKFSTLLREAVAQARSGQI
jgi:hypothetical protein